MIMHKSSFWIVVYLAIGSVLGGCTQSTAKPDVEQTPEKEEAFAFPEGPPKDMTAIKDVRPLKAGDRIVYLSEFTARRSKEDYPRKFFSYRFIETATVNRGGKNYLVIKDSSTALKTAISGEVKPPQVGRRWYHDPATLKLVAFENPPLIAEMMPVTEELPYPNQMTAGAKLARSVTLQNGKTMSYTREVGGLTKAGSLSALVDVFELKELETDGTSPIETVGLFSPTINAWVHFKRTYESAGYQWEESGALIEHTLAP
jgi:hypothetical protein